MFYKLLFDMDIMDDTEGPGINTIYAESTNMDEIVYEDITKGFFDNLILSPRRITYWPRVNFYYDSEKSNGESDYLPNVKSWPIVHNRVAAEFKKENIKGVEFFPVNLVDMATQKINADYSLMYISAFIDAFDMRKSKYKYNERYDYYTFVPGKTFLNQSICSEYDIFRCIKSPSAIYVSEKIRAIIELNQWTGFAFYAQL